VGILVATLVVNKYLTAVNHVKALCKKHGKRSYIISVGKPNVPKLANFPEVSRCLKKVVMGLMIGTYLKSEERGKTG
jgi:diphthamide biosynthesis enzyme Dph1/Dph2 domain